MKLNKPVDSKEINLKTANNTENHGFLSGDAYNSSDNYYKFILEEEGDKKLIWSVGLKSYAKLDDNGQDNGSLLFTADNENAERFSFLTFSESIDPDLSFSIKLAGTDKYIKTSNNDGDPLTVDGTIENGTIPLNIKFKNVAFGTEATRPTVSLVSGYGKGIVSGNNDTDIVCVNGSITGGGWESIRIIPNGDGTFSFRSSQNNYPINVAVQEDGKTVLKREKAETDPLTDKFVIHINDIDYKDYIPILPIKTVGNIQKGDCSASTINLSWDYPETLFTDMVLEYQMEGESDWKEKPLTSDEMCSSSCTVTGLQKEKKYKFRFQVILKSDNTEIKSEYSEEKEAETNNKLPGMTIRNMGDGKKYLKTYKTVGTPLTVDGNAEGEPGTLFNKEIISSDKTEDGAVKHMVQTFVSSDYNTAVATNSDNMAKVRDNGIGGWESILIVPNSGADGSVSFGVSNLGSRALLGVNSNNNLVAVTGKKVGEGNLTRLPEEKFTIHTDLYNDNKPAAVTGLAADGEKSTASTIDLSWDYPEILFTNMKLYYQKDGGNDWTLSRELTSDEMFNSSCTVTGLEASTDYKFKLQVIMKSNDGEGNSDSIEEFTSDDSNIAEASTNDKPGVTVDKSVLQEKYDGYKDQEAKYTAESWASFKTVLDKAAALLNNASASQTDIDNALTELTTAAGNLVEKTTSGGGTDISALQTAYNKYAAYKEADYKPEGWAEFKAALIIAKEQIDKGTSAVQPDVDNALIALNEAAGKLVRNDGTTQPPGGEVTDSVTDGNYAIISKTTGLALDAKAVSWNNDLVADAFIDSKSGKIGSANAHFNIKKTGKYDSAVMIICHVGEETKPMMVEGNNEFAFIDGNNREEQDSHFIIESTGNGTFRIKTSSKGRYASIDPSNSKLLFKADTTKDNAEEFTFIKNPALFDTSISIQHKSSGKYVKTYKADGIAITVNGNKGGTGTVFDKVVFNTNDSTASGEEYTTAAFISRDYKNGMKSVVYDASADNSNGAKAAQVLTHNTDNADNFGKGWESIRIVPNGDGTVSFKDSYFDQYITVQGISLACRKIAEGTTREKLTDKEKFIIHTDSVPEAVNGLEVNQRTRTKTTLDLTWKTPVCLYTSLVIEKKLAGEDDSKYEAVATLGDEESYTVTGLEKGTDYKFRIRLDFYNGTDTYSSKPVEVSGSTIETDRPAAPSDVHVKESADGVLTLSWDKVEGANGYYVYEARSKYDKDGYKRLGYFTNESAVIPTASEPGNTEGRDKYSYYFYVQAVAGTGESSVESDESETVSLETEMFGNHTVFFAPTDDVQKIDKVLADIFESANDYDNDAQFNGEQWQVYFKPGDYTEAGCMYLGFYTSFNGLGRTPYDVKLNNIAIPAYLPNGALGAGENNATCNFWRSAENLSVMFTGNEQGRAKEMDKTKKGKDCYRPESFNWAVAQAAPLRRVYSERPVAYDWNFGWASGGYVADCYFTGADDDGNSAGTASGQQFFTRNTKVEGNTFGTTLNNFFLGVEAANNLSGKDGKSTALKNNNGYTNWGIEGNKDGDGKIPQQVITEITETPEVSEKPFLYFDNGEYKVFVPAVQKNRRGISWGEGKENEGMGKGTSLSLSDFYIASPSDSAADINKQIEAGKNIYFTPGIYHAEVPINVNRENAILLGSGMASIIPDNDEMAMRVSDLDGIRIEGLIFDAGLSSKYLLQVGEEKTEKSHAGNPIILQDLFFRVGGTTDVLTKADDALEINCNNVIGDHFWIWRADHGAGVEWYGNESKHGLIVNGDNVSCYALFNEHFQEYHTLWNGENGATYFYQNETCYDPISQEAWMSHGGTVKGYSSYKVSNDVKNHYAVGLGVYNVFIYTGPLYDAKGVGIQLDNAIEVPNSENVLVENACIQTFANDDGALARINHIINGVGGSASSGYNNETEERGESWSRKFLLYYNNGMAEYGKETNPATFNFTNGHDPKDQRNQFIGTEKRTAENPVQQPEDEKIFLDRIEKLVGELSKAVETDYTKKSWNNASLEEALAKAREMIEIGKSVLNGSYSPKLRMAVNYNQYFISKIQSEINKACTVLEAAGEKLVYIGDATRLHGVCDETINEADYQKNDKWYAYISAMEEVERILKESENADISTKKKIYELQLEIDAAYEALRLARLNLTGEDDALNITGLREAYDKYAAYKQSDYKTEGWADFAKALADAKAELDKGTKAVQEDVDRALAALNTAAGKLVRISGGSTNLSKLKEAYDKYSVYKQSDYRIEGWADFAKALANAKVQLDKGESAAESDVAAALAALNTAAGKLVKNSGSGSSGGSGGGSSLDSWLEGMLSNALANNSNVNTGDLLDAIAGITDAKTDLDETQGKADALLEVINALIGNSTGSAFRVTGISLNKSSLSLDKGKKAVLKATITPADAVNKNIIWYSNNVKVATVDQKGNVKAVGKGTAKITAVTADGMKKAVCKVTVKVPAVKITLNKKKLYIVKGKSKKLKAVMTPAGTTDKVKWSTSNSSVVSVKNGKLKAKKAGTAVITAKTSSGKKAKCKVYVS